MDKRYFDNPFEDYNGQQVSIDENHIRNLVKNYVADILKHTKDERRSNDARGDLYVGDAGKFVISFVFNQMSLH